MLLSGMIPSENMVPCLDVLVSSGATRLVVGCVEQLQDRKEAAEAVERCRYFLIERVWTTRAYPERTAALSGLTRLWTDDLTRQVLTELADSSINATGDWKLTCYILPAVMAVWPVEETFREVAKALRHINRLSRDATNDWLPETLIDAFSSTCREARPLLEELWLSDGALAKAAAVALVRHPYLTEEEPSSLYTFLDQI